MTSPDSSTLQAAAQPDKARAERSGLAGMLPAGRTGAVMLRSLRYIWRDPKTKTAWFSSLTLGLLVPILNAAQGHGSLYFAFFAPALLGMQMYLGLRQPSTHHQLTRASRISHVQDPGSSPAACARPLLEIFNGSGYVGS